MIGTGLALGIGLAASAGTQLVGAKIASNASKNAAKDQVRAVDRASGILDETFSPYVNKGREVIGTLGRLTAAPRGARYAAPDPTMPRQAPQPARPRPAGAMPTGQARPRVTLGGLAPRGGDGMVLMEAPDGSGVRPVPANQVERFLAAGARRVQ